MNETADFHGAVPGDEPLERPLDLAGSRIDDCGLDISPRLLAPINAEPTTALLL